MPKLSRPLGPYLQKFNNLTPLEISRVSTISHLSTILSKESAHLREYRLTFAIFNYNGLSIELFAKVISSVIPAKAGI